MILRYATNLKLAKELYNASKPKLQGDQGMVDTFTNTFGLPASSVKVAVVLKLLQLHYLLQVS